MCCGVAALLGVYALKVGRKAAARMLLAAKIVMFIAGGLCIVEVNQFIRAFITDDFSIAAVARHSSPDMAFIYKLGAAWAGPGGSLLLWAAGSVVLFALWLVTLKTDGSVFNATAMIVGAVVCLGFSLLVLLVARPFAGAAEKAAGAAGLSPLLRSFWMVVHPPAILLAYSAFLIPFIVVVASVFGGGTEVPELYMQMRRWLLVGVGFLCLGTVAGARWAYMELDWGGYWAWDPIQNLSLLPILTAVAALHSINAIQLADKFRRWTLALAPAPFVLCLLLAFVSSSDVIKSVHTFGRSEASGGLLSFGGACFMLWLFCLDRSVRTVSVAEDRRDVFRQDKAKILLWSNVGFVAIAAIIALATFLPVILRTVADSTSVRISTEFFYTGVISVVGIGLLFLMGYYRLMDLRERWDSSRLPVLACSAAGIILFGVLYRTAEKPLLLCLACASGLFSCIAILLKLFVALKSGEKFGGCIAHLGVVLVLVSAGFSRTNENVRASLAEGNKLTLSGWEFVYDAFETKISDGVEKAGPHIVLSKGSRQTRLWPHRDSYPGSEQPGGISRPAVNTGVFDDICVSFEALTSDGKVVITAEIKPFVFWLWLGAALIVVGAALAAFEGRGVLQPPGTSRGRLQYQ
ncbi:MAG: cytochrome c biogenesis protein CcsA [Phycisphaerae bacterium]|nr:cytochrome c biogenesis protein CcsA [Phycisphaerae bacterium]